MFICTVEFKKRRIETASCFEHSRLGQIVHVFLDGKTNDVGVICSIWEDLCPASIPAHTIIRAAYQPELERLFSVHSKMEDEATKYIISRLSNHKLESEMFIKYVEITFDCSKVTIYYTCNNRVDFRELTKELFKLFRSRIWFERLTPDVNYIS